MRNILNESGLPYDFWIEVIIIAMYLVDHYLSKAISLLKPFELSNKQMITYSCIIFFFL